MTGTAIAEQKYTREELSLIKSRAALIEIALAKGARTKARMSGAALIDAILEAQGDAPTQEAPKKKAPKEKAAKKPKGAKKEQPISDDVEDVDSPAAGFAFNTAEEAVAEIARTSVEKERAIEALSHERKELNNEVKQARAAHEGAIEAGVNYSDPIAVRAKLEEVTTTWSHLQECEEKRRQELIPFKEQVQAARKRYREALDGAKQLKLFGG